MFYNSVNQLALDKPEIWQRFTVGMGLEFRYKGRKGCYVPDVSVVTDLRNVFHVEIAVSQSMSDVHKKIRNILQDDIILGVLLISIKEKPKWESPARCPLKEEWMDTKDWLLRMERKGPFGSITHNGITWVHDIDVQVYLFEGGWNESMGDPDNVSLFFTSMHSLYITLIYLLKYTMPAEGSFIFPKLDRDINEIWNSIIQQMIGQSQQDVQANEFSIDWLVLRKLLANSIPLMAHACYEKWFDTIE